MSAPHDRAESGRFTAALRHLLTVKPADLKGKEPARKHPAKPKPSRKRKG